MGAAFQPWSGPDSADHSANLRESCYERGKQNGCLAWLRSAWAGEINWIPQMWESILLCPFRDIFYFPGGNKMDSYGKHRESTGKAYGKHSERIGKEEEKHRESIGNA